MLLIYCALILIIGTLAIAIIVFTFVMNGCCVNPPWSASSSLIPRSTSPGGDQKGSSALWKLSPNSASSFRYKKGLGNVEGATADITECVVCLLGFEDDEEVRKLHRCNDSFHAPCIDIWMYSHSNCPIFRNHVDRRDALVFTSDDNFSMEVLTDTSISPKFVQNYKLLFHALLRQ